MRNTRLLIAGIALTMLMHGAVAHGVPKPKHGGTVDVGGEVSFEMVMTKTTMKFYIEDHGKPIPTQNAVGELLLGSETGKKIGSLTSAGTNSMEGKRASFKTGDRLFVRVVLGDGSIVVGELIAP